MRGPLGGGTPQRTLVRIGERREKHTLQTRIGIWGVGWLGVINEGPLAGRFVVYNHDEKRWQVVASVFHAIRQTWHILFQYGQDVGYGEMQRMARAAALARELNLTVLGYGRPRASIQDLRSRTRVAIREASGLLGRPRKPTKVEAQRQLAALDAMRDSRGQANPGAAMARTVKARDALLERLEKEILQIDPHIFRRQRTLIRLVHYAEQIILHGVRHFLENVSAEPGILQLHEQPVRRQVAQHCRYLAGDLERLDFRPYRDTCTETATDMRAVADILDSGDDLGEARIFEIRRLFGNCQSAMTLKAVQLRVERLLYMLMRDGELPKFSPVSFAEEIESVIRLLAEADDSTFRVPVRDAAGSHFAAAVAAVGFRQLAEAKEQLKAASDVL